MFIILPITALSKEQTTLLFAVPCFSLQYLYTRTTSGPFVCFHTVETDTLIARVLLNLPNYKCLIQPSEYEFNLIFLPGPPGGIIARTLHRKCLGRGAGIHLQDPSHGTTPIPLFIPRAQWLAGDSFGSAASLHETCCVLKPTTPSLPVLP